MCKDDVHDDQRADGVDIDDPVPRLDEARKAGGLWPKKERGDAVDDDGCVAVGVLRCVQDEAADQKREKWGTRTPRACFANALFGVRKRSRKPGPPACACPAWLPSCECPAWLSSSEKT